MTIDLDRAEEVFAASVDGTVGIEEEFAILDPESLDMVPRFEELRDSAAEHDSVLAESIAGELISSEIEITSGRGDNLADALSRQGDARRRLLELADRHGVLLSSTGTHPWADYRQQSNIDTEHYRRVVDGLQYVARRNNTFSAHVHVGVNGIDRAMRVCDRLRPVLPVLLARSANSPYLDGLDAGLHSARSQAFTKSFPRCGIPDAYGSWASYRDYLQLLIDTDSVQEYTQIWWSVRPHFSFGTVEVRICDAQTDAAESDELVKLLTACVLQAVADQDEGRVVADLPRRLIEENFWRAIRYGQDGRMIDFQAGREIEMDEALEQLLNWTAPARAAAGIGDIDVASRNGAQRQRALIDSGASMRETFAAAVRETQTSYVRGPYVQ